MTTDNYAPLDLVAIAGSDCTLEDAGTARKVTAASPAIDIMTDLRLVPAATIAPDTPLPDATQAMILRGVRSLFVVDSARSMLGLLCANDVLAEAPIKVAAERGVSPTELTARDVMVPSASVEAVDLADVMRSDVGHVAATLRRSGRHHLMVVQRDASGKVTVRGLFSATQIARQLGIGMPTGNIAKTFAEIEAALVT